MSVLAELDKSMLVLKLRKAREHKRRTTGRCEGPKPYGSLPEEKPLWNFICARRQAGDSYAAISKALASQDTPGEWSKDRVRGVLCHGLRAVPTLAMPA